MLGQEGLLGVLGGGVALGVALGEELGPLPGDPVRTGQVAAMGRNGAENRTCILCGEKAPQLAVFAKAY